MSAGQGGAILASGSYYSIYQSYFNRISAIQAGVILAIDNSLIVISGTDFVFNLALFHGVFLVTGYSNLNLSACLVT